MTVEGHGDGSGTDSTNQPLSRDRAMSVREHLGNEGVDPARISAVGPGSKSPQVPDSNAENDRRVVTQRETVTSPRGVAPSR